MLRSAEEPYQWPVHVVVVLAESMFLDEAPVRQFRQVLARRQAGNLEIILHRLDACVRVAKQVRKQFMAVNLRQNRTHAFLVVTHEIAN